MLGVLFVFDYLWKDSVPFHSESTDLVTPYITSADVLMRKIVFPRLFSNLPPYWYICKPPWESVKTFQSYLRGFSMHSYFHDQLFIAIFRFCTIVGFKKMQLWVVSTGPEDSSPMLHICALHGSLMVMLLVMILSLLDSESVCLCAGGAWSTARFWRTTGQKRRIKRRSRYCTAPPDLSFTVSESESQAEGFNGVEWLQGEDVSDEAFARRHSVSERSEKMHRMSWGKRPCCRHPKRCVAANKIKEEIRIALRKSSRFPPAMQIFYSVINRLLIDQIDWLTD